MARVDKVMFVHPSRGRPKIAIEAAYRMIAKMQSNVPFTYYLGLDSDDYSLPDYKDEIEKSGLPIHTVVGNNRGCVEATNRAARKFGGEDLLVANGDDLLILVDGWDVRIFDLVKTIDRVDYLIHFPDLAENADRVALAQIMSGGLYKRLGNFFYPSYISMYADADLWETCNVIGAIYNFKSPPRLFGHDHPFCGGSMKMDETYERTNSDYAYGVGEEVFEKRRSKCFPPNYRQFIPF